MGKRLLFITCKVKKADDAFPLLLVYNISVCGTVRKPRRLEGHFGGRAVPLPPHAPRRPQHLPLRRRCPSVHESRGARFLPEEETTQDRHHDKNPFCQGSKLESKFRFRYRNFLTVVRISSL